MVRKLKHHEQKLLRKVDFLTYKSDANHRASAVRARYHLSHPLDYEKYNRLCGLARKLAHTLSALDPADPFRIKTERALLEKLWAIGVLGRTREGRSEMGVSGVGLAAVEREVTVAAFARRRLGVVMVRMGMVEHVPAAHQFIEQGHVRVGTDVVTDPAFLVTRNMEDFVTWVESSKIRRNIMQYREKLDDFELL